MYRFLGFVAAVLFAVSVLHGCGARNVAVSSVEPAKNVHSQLPPVSRNDSLRFKYFYYEALKQQIKGNYGAAYELLCNCLRINPNSAEAYYYLSSYEGVLNGDSAALQKIRRAAELRPENATFQERLAVAYLNLSKYGEARKVYERLYAGDPSRTDVLQMLLKLYGVERDYDNMIRTIENIEEQDGVTEQTALAKMNVYSMQGKKEKEIKVLRELSAKHPYDMNYRVMIGNWLLQNGDNDGAHREYAEVLEAEPENAMAQMSMLDYYRAVGKDSLAGTLREKMLFNPDNSVDTKVTLIRQIVDETEKKDGDSTYVLNLLERMLDMPQKTPDIAGVYLAYLNLKKMPQDTIRAFEEKFLADFPDYAPVRMDLVQKALSMQDADRVIELCRPAIEYNPDEMVFYYFLGLAYIDKGMEDETLDVIRRGLSLDKKGANQDMVSDLYAIMGDLLCKKDEYVKAFAAYDSCLQWKDDNMGCLNNYAYYLSLNGGDLTKAEQMSYRTVKQEPSNSTYLDTYAWILFMQERYAEAKLYINQAVASDTIASDVILEHAGDIYAMNGDIVRALDYWRKAKDAGSESKVLIRKIRQKKYIKDENK
ncbi:MAG: tetratricopeptide repeat protein [Prevotella sp.]|nr:tetratricopeptide repeat protein [Prevotella sp.]